MREMTEPPRLAAGARIPRPARYCACSFDRLAGDTGAEVAMEAVGDPARAWPVVEEEEEDGDGDREYEQ